MTIHDATQTARALDARDEQGQTFEDLYRRYRAPVHRYLARRTSDEATAEDLTAQVFLQAFRSLPGYRGEGSPRSWLFTIARNTLASHLAERQSRPQVSVADVPEETDGEDSPSVVALAREERRHIWDAVGDLPEAQREVVLLRYLTDLSIDEIAGSTGRTSGAIRVLLHRARASLRKRLNAKDLGVILGATGAVASVALITVRRQRRRDS